MLLHANGFDPVALANAPVRILQDARRGRKKDGLIDLGLITMTDMWTRHHKQQCHWGN